MREILAFKKETDNKFRWDANINGASFELYIPKWRVPTPPPTRIRVKIYLPTEVAPSLKRNSQDDIRRNPALRKNPIGAKVAYHSELTKTVRYDPIGDDKTWEIGSPYIPYGLLSRDLPREVSIVVDWTE